MREKRRGNIKEGSIYIGDSQYDVQAAKRANLKFIFASAWTEFHDWQTYCKSHAIPVVKNVSDLIGVLEK
jgi:phosphoglycolate phosphatase-like HAD superfamily hydrolase